MDKIEEKKFHSNNNPIVAAASSECDEWLGRNTVKEISVSESFTFDNGRRWEADGVQILQEEYAFTVLLCTTVWSRSGKHTEI